MKLTPTLAEQELARRKANRAYPKGDKRRTSAADPELLKVTNAELRRFTSRAK